MNIEQAATNLVASLRAADSNVQTVGIRGNNMESYKKNPEQFASEITEDSLVVYTFKKPTKRELLLTSYEGFKVEWHRSGWVVMIT